MKEQFDEFPEDPFFSFISFIFLFMEPFQIILNDLGCTLGLFSLCKVSKSVSTSYEKRGDTTF